MQTDFARFARASCACNMLHNKKLALPPLFRGARLRKVVQCNFFVAFGARDPIWSHVGVTDSTIVSNYGDVDYAGFEPWVFSSWADMFPICIYIHKMETYAPFSAKSSSCKQRPTRQHSRCSNMLRRHDQTLLPKDEPLYYFNHSPINFNDLHNKRTNLYFFFSGIFF